MCLGKIEASHWWRGEMNRPIAAALQLVPSPLMQAKTDNPDSHSTSHQVILENSALTNLIYWNAP